MSSALTGTAPLLRATFRYEGRGFAPWIVLVTALSMSSVLVYPWIFPDQQDRAALAAAIGSNPAIGLIFGPAFDISTTDGFNAWRSLALGGFLAALGAIFTVTRTTRGQEDSGQAELLAAGVLGRDSRLLSGVGLALIGSVAVGVVSAIATGLSGGGWEASILLGATFTATGWMFVGIAAVTAQLGSDARTANTLAVGVLGSLFILRGFAYAVSAPDWTVWINPLGWMTETRPANGDHWWPLWLALVFALAMLVLAFTVQSRRDFGVGILAPRPGPARGRIRSTARLALRLNRAPLITWGVAFIALGVAYGYFTTSITDILSADSAVARILASGATTPEALVSAFVVTVLSLVGIIAAVPGVQVMLKLRTEEMEDRIEPLVAASVQRQRLYAGNVVLAFIAPAAFVMLAGTIIGVLASAADIGVDFGSVVVQSAATIPAVWTIVAVAVAVMGIHPQVSIAAWVGVVASFALTILGPTFKLWDWILAISPFWHVPNVTHDSADWWGLVWVSLVTLALLGVGFAGFRRRDLAR